MASPIRTQGTLLRVSIASAATVVITNISQATEAVVTTSGTAPATGTVVVIASVAGMVEVNDRAFVVTNLTGTTFKLTGVDSTAFTAYSSGGTFSVQTMTAIDRVENLSLFDGTKDKIVVSHLMSTAVERDSGLPDTGQCSFEMQIVASDAGQTRLLALFDNGASAAFTAVRRDGKAAAFVATVETFPANASVNNVWRGQVSLSLTGARQWFA